jgi:hypothetical protein
MPLTWSDGIQVVPNGAAAALDVPSEASIAWRFHSTFTRPKTGSSRQG